MTKPFVLLSALLLAGSAASAQAPAGSGPAATVQKSPDQQAQRRAQYLAKELRLSTDQQARLEPILLAQRQDMQALRDRVQTNGRQRGMGRNLGALKAELGAVRPIPKGPDSVAVGIPADTLRNRPDVRAAERNLAAATAQIGVAKAALYPALAISGSVSTNATVIGSLFDQIAGQLFAGLTQAIFNGGRLRAQVRSNEAAADAAFAAYKGTVLTGLEDVENAIVALDASQRRAREFAVALDGANNAAILSRSSYRAGLTDFTTLNVAENSLLTARNGLSQAQADQAQALIQLYLALGGGWDAASGAPQAPQDR